ncbi:hypothetical protein BTVI_41596 [Pitangus sulphuratus]|nr:hypothetical protein BTVI_41596 [Pitangus sulphuratus]
MDVPTTDTVTISSTDVIKVPLDAKGSISQGLSALLIGRSSTTIFEITVHVGVIDADYTGQICTMISTPYPPVTIPKGTRIAQLVPFEVSVGQKLLSSAEPVDGFTVFTDGSGRTGRVAVVWHMSTGWQHELVQQSGSPQIVELRATALAFQLFPQAFNLVIDNLVITLSAYVAGLIRCLDQVVLSTCDDHPLFQVLLMLWRTLQFRTTPYFFIFAVTPFYLDFLLKEMLAQMLFQPLHRLVLFQTNDNKLSFPIASFPRQHCPQATIWHHTVAYSLYCGCLVRVSMSLLFMGPILEGYRLYRYGKLMLLISLNLVVSMSSQAVIAPVPVQIMDRCEFLLGARVLFCLRETSADDSYTEQLKRLSPWNSKNVWVTLIKH